MAFVVNNKVVASKLIRQLDKSKRENINSLEKLSSGTVFTSTDSKPSERAIAEGLEFRLRSLAASKKNINNAVSLIQTAESGLQEVNNLLTRMKEINIAASSTTLNDRDRRYLFIEYEALYDEMNRIAVTTKFNGVPLLNGESEDVPEALVFRLDDPVANELDSGDGEDINTLTFEGIKDVVATAEGLGLRSARELLLDSDEEEGLEIEEAEELMYPEDDDLFETVYDEALSKLSTQRAIFGAMHSRLDMAISYNQVYTENIAAAKSKISDTDYASEVTKIAQNNVLTQATTALLAHNNENAQMALGLVASALK